jgi:hypothetical protein
MGGSGVDKRRSQILPPSRRVLRARGRGQSSQGNRNLNPVNVTEGTTTNYRGSAGSIRNRTAYSTSRSS